MSPMLEKFKEKKLNVVSALKELMDAMYPALGNVVECRAMASTTIYLISGIEAIQEDCLAALKHKTPSVKAETASFLARCFAKCPPILATNKKILKGKLFQGF